MLSKMVVMHNNSKLTEVLNDLVRINNDRIEGYEKAKNEEKIIDADLQLILSRMVEESIKYKNELIKAV